MAFSKQNAGIAALLFAHVGLLLFLVFFRILDYDEGFYLLSARSVAGGSTLYTDFFYPQAPFLPYLLSPFAENGFATLHASRLVGAAMCVCGLFAFLFLVSRLAQNAQTKLLVLFLYCFSTLTLIWHSAAKTYAWTDPLLLCSFAVMYLYSVKRNWVFAALAGALLAVAVNIRITLSPVIVLWGWYIWKITKNENQNAAVPFFVFVGSTALVSIPSLIMLFTDTNRFLFDNIIFHTMRNPGVGFLQSIVDRLVVIGKLVINPVLLFPLILTVIAIREKKCADAKKDESTNEQFLKLSWLTALSISVIYLLPNPIHQQYFVQAIPFALIGGCALKRLPSNRPVLIACRVLYVGMLVPYLYTFVGGVRESDQKSKLTDIRSVVEFLNNGDKSDELIYAETPIIPALASCQTFPELTFVGFEYYLPISDDQKRHYRLPVTADLNTLIDQKIPAYCVVINEPVTELTKVINRQYRETARFGCYRVFAPR